VSSGTCFVGFAGVPKRRSDFVVRWFGVFVT
jgi:hypothetical protein